MKQSLTFIIALVVGFFITTPAKSTEGTASGIAAPSENHRTSINPIEPNEGYFISLVKYKNDVTNNIAREWREQVEKNKSGLKPGVVSFRYFINPSGQISLIEMERGKKEGLLYNISKRAIASINQQPRPFPKEIRRTLEGGFFHNIGFRIEQ